MSAEQNVATVRHLFEGIDSGNPNVLDEVSAPTFTVHFPGAPAPLPPAAAKPLWASFYAAFPDLRHSIEDLVVEADKVAVRLSIRGTHRGDFQGMPPTGKSIDISALNIFHFADGKILKQWIEYDALGMLQQLGVTAAPEGGA